MPTQSHQPNPYKVGGCLGFDHPSYVTRQADRALLAALTERQFCYVFNCRQMGKSSLRVRAMHQLACQGMRCVSIDMTLLGSQITPQQWYGGMITQLFQGLSLFGRMNLKGWLQDHAHLSPVQQLGQFLTYIVLSQTGNDPHSARDQRPIFVFIDEIDKILSLDFSVDDFFALIRFFYNQRAENPAFNDLTFALFGVATPSDLIQDKTQTLFNIGQAVELAGFSIHDAQPLVKGLVHHCADPQAVLQEILAWTSGQPFLTQKLCQMVVSGSQFIPEGKEVPGIESLVRSQLINNWESQDEPVHLKTIRDRLLNRPRSIARQLLLYQQIWQQGYYPAAATSEQSELRLSGLVVLQQGQLRVYNRIYYHIFDQQWIDQVFAQLRPYAEAIAAWEKSGRQDESRLLRGLALRDALKWSESKSLGGQDYQFLTASQELDNRMALEQERRQREVERLETQLVAEQLAKQALSQAYTQAKRRLRIASIILAVSVMGSAIAAGWVGYAFHQQHQVQVEALDWAGKSAMSQFDFSQMDALLTAMQAGQSLKSMVKPTQSLRDYPTLSPMDALQDILAHIRERNHLTGHQESINGISISPNGQIVATASRDGTAKLWTIQGIELLTLATHQGDVHGVHFSPDGQKVATASKDGTAKIWSLQGELLMTLKHQSEVYSVSFSPNGEWIATASRNGTAHLWTTQGQYIAPLVGHNRAIYSISFSSDSSQVVTASRDGTAKVWSSKGKLRRSLQHRSKRAIYSASFSPDGQKIATAGQDGLAQIWSNGQKQQTLQGHQGSIYDVSFDPTGQFLVTTSEDETIKIWTLQGKELLTLQGFQGAVYDANFSAQGTYLATASHEKSATLWDLQHYPLLAQVGHPDEVAALRVGSDGERIVTAFTSGRVMIQDQNNQILSQFKAGSTPLYDVSFSPTGKHLAMAFADGTVRLTDPQGKLFKQFQAHNEIIYSISFHPSGQLIATSSRDNRVKVWTLEGQLQQELLGHQDAVYDVAFSPDGQWLATASSDRMAKVWTLKGELHATLKGHQGAIHQVEFSPDSQSLATASTDETARLWDLQGKERAVFLHDSGLVFRIGFSPDGSKLATGSKDGSISLWNLDGTIQDHFKGHQSLIMEVLFPSNNELMTIAQNDKQRKVWPISTSVSARLDSLLDQGCVWLKDYFESHPQQQLSVCQP